MVVVVVATVRARRSPGVMNKWHIFATYLITTRTGLL